MTKIFKGNMKEFVAQQSDPDWRKENFDKSCRFLAEVLGDIVRKDKKVPLDYDEWHSSELKGRGWMDLLCYLEGRETYWTFNYMLKSSTLLPFEYVQKFFRELIDMQSIGRAIAPVAHSAYLGIPAASNELRDGLFKALTSIFEKESDRCTDLVGRVTRNFGPIGIQLEKKQIYPPVPELKAGFGSQEGKPRIELLGEWFPLSKVCKYLVEEQPKTDFVVSGHFLDTVLAYNKAEQK